MAGEIAAQVRQLPIELVKQLNIALKKLESWEEFFAQEWRDQMIWLEFDLSWISEASRWRMECRRAGMGKGILAKARDNGVRIKDFKIKKKIKKKKKKR